MKVIIFYISFQHIQQDKNNIIKYKTIKKQIIFINVFLKTLSNDSKTNADTLFIIIIGNDGIVYAR